MKAVPEKSVPRTSWKKHVLVWNRRLAWVTFPTLVISTVLYYGARWGLLPITTAAGGMLSGIFTLMFLVHSAFAVYLFRFPRWRPNIRILHIYLGYVVFVLTLTSQSLIGHEPWHNIFYLTNWLFVLSHVALSTRFMLQRRYPRRRRDAELTNFASGH